MLKKTTTKFATVAIAATALIAVAATGDAFATARTQSAKFHRVPTASRLNPRPTHAPVPPGTLGCSPTNAGRICGPV
jgi:hypothetical protein